MSSFAAWRLSSLLLLAGCGQIPTSLVVVVDSDLMVPDELGLVTVVLRDADGEPTTASDFNLEETPLPLSFGVAPQEDDASRTVVVEVRAARRDRLPLFSRRAETGFVEGERKLLKMMLAGRCRTEAATCGAEETCTEMGCASPMVDPQTLDGVEPGEELDAAEE